MNTKTKKTNHSKNQDKMLDLIYLVTFDLDNSGTLLDNNLIDRCANNRLLNESNEFKVWAAINYEFLMGKACESIGQPKDTYRTPAQQYLDYADLLFLVVNNSIIMAAVAQSGIQFDIIEME